MKKLHLPCLLVACCLMLLSCSYKQAAESSPPRMGVEITRAPGEHFMPEGATSTIWGTETILAADILFRISLFSGEDDWEGVEFPFVLGYLAFSDEDNLLRLIFTPVPGYDSSRLSALFERINRDGFHWGDLGKIYLDDKDFYLDFASDLRWARHILFVKNGEIGYFQNFDITFTNTKIYTRNDPKFIQHLDYGEVILTPKQ